MTDKVFSPEVIQEQPFPGEDAPVPITAPQSPGISTPTITQPKPFRRKVISDETIASSLNTRSRKILQEFELQQFGGIQIGNFKEGISGDLRLTPNGITARDLAGLTTFAIDALTGDAIFKGTVQSGSVVTGEIQAEVLEIVGGGIMAVATEGSRSLGGFNSIQDAIDWVNGFGGGTVVLPANTYTLTDDVTLYSNVSLQGDDDERTILDFSGLVKGIKIVGTSGSHKINVAIRDLQLRNYSGDDTGGIYGQYADDIIIERCKFYNGKQYSPDNISDIRFLTPCENIRINNCKFVDSYRAIYADGAITLVSVTNSTFDNCLKVSIYPGSGNNWTINSNYFVDVDDICVEISGTHKGLIVQSNTATTIASYFCWGEEVNGVAILDNTVDGCTQDYAIYLDNTSGANSFNNITSNRMISVVRGIHIVSSSQNTIIGNVIDHSTLYGIYIEDTRSNFNLIIGNLHGGNIKIDGTGADNNILVGNTNDTPVN